MPDRWLRANVFEQHVITKFMFISFEIFCNFVTVCCDGFNFSFRDYVV